MVSIPETVIVRKQTSNPAVPHPSDVADRLFHAIAFVMLQRQMKARWTLSTERLRRPPKPAVALEA
jgi:hypothetical protein